MQIRNGEYIDDNKRLMLVISHDRGKNEINFRIIINFNTGLIDSVVVERARRFDGLRDAFVKFVREHDWDISGEMELVFSDRVPKDVFEKFRLYTYFRAMELGNYLGK